MEFVVALLVGPTLAVILGITGYLLTKTLFIAPLIVAIGTTIASFTLFNSSFLVYVFVYSILALLSGWLFSLLKER
ncbi:hypothetical protein JOC54_000418 [Alkalihalobacillus xiaoxiensis]|uniref:DUF2651 domain-containing protein n=1 Tax=Shouchella xiaoxiensis TaxID=766895 RepID=A0ABS2SNU7_9BACI|nr:DUF2651 family protein [Shouchella xiaoxiensis]MBM7837187.1 hypothetical protein [Shouchella xiaoxiensis]